MEHEFPCQGDRAERDLVQSGFEIHEHLDGTAPLAKRDAAEHRWNAIKVKIAKLDHNGADVDVDEELPVMRVDELIAYAELYAGADRLGAVDPPRGAFARAPRRQ